MAERSNAVEQTVIIDSQQYLFQMLPGNPTGQNSIAQFPGDVILRHKGQRVADYSPCNDCGNGADPKGHAERNDQDRLDRHQRKNPMKTPKANPLAR